MAGNSLTGDDIDESTFSTSPTGPAGGSLTGNFPNPILGQNVVGETVEAGDAEQALAQLPPYVAERTEVSEVREVPIP